MKTRPLSLVTLALSSSMVFAAPDLILTNGDIVTVTGEQARAQAIAIKDGNIVAVGTNDNLLKQKNKDTVVRDLQGKTVTPGFIDAHGHFAQYLPLIENEFLYPAPMGDIGSIEDIDKKMRKYFARKDLDKRILHVAFGYDEALLLNSVGRHGSLKLFGS